MEGVNANKENRKLAHTKLGLDLVRRMIEDIGPIGKVDAEPRMEGKQVMTVLSPGVAVVPKDAPKEVAKEPVKEPAK